LKPVEFYFAATKSTTVPKEPDSAPSCSREVQVAYGSDFGASAIFEKHNGRPMRIRATDLYRVNFPSGLGTDEVE